MHEGDLLVNSEGHNIPIDQIKKEVKEDTVYNFEVQDFHTYFISDLKIWVHNCSIKHGPKYSTKTYNQWYKGTWKNKTKSMDYHLRKHSKGRTPEQYTQVAMRFFSKNKHLAQEVTLSTGKKGYKIQTGTGKNKVGGFWTKDGKLVTFWD